MEPMPKTDPRSASSPAAPQPPKPQALNTARAVQSEVIAVTQQLASDVSADAYAIGQQSAEYVNQQAFTAFLAGFNEGAANANSPFSQLRQQLSASKPQAITLLSLPASAPGSTNTALPERCPPSVSP
jgi:flagellar biosynthesis/type III secretory pathway protein FliH